ncbi:BTB/POZ domain-containing protein [Hibiscus syriacus]|uniref:BTB/POZ domain-containing protein n=1 Tax=Hibiscus syriacus TaxID=106335 RepID=A0A6A2ZLP1_HIBSY|nr:BTB/POZ domain-containing protein [Hibiscus syriacus]
MWLAFVPHPPLLLPTSNMLAHYRALKPANPPATCGAIAFELISKFCYGVRIELTAQNVASIRCAAEYLLLNHVKKSCRMPRSFHIVSRCIDSLATKACADPSLFGWPLPGREAKKSPRNEGLWNGISTAMKTQHTEEDWWYQEVSFLSLPLYKRLILAIESRGLRPESIAALVDHYARRYLPLINRQSSFDDMHNVNTVTTSEADQRALLEEIVGLLPNKKEVTSSKFLIRLLRTAKVLHASPSCRENLEMRVGTQLDQASLVDILIPNMGYSETRFDVDCVQRILDHFMLVQQAAASATPCNAEEGELTNGSLDSLTPMTMVATLIDGFLAELASDVNFKLPKFEALAPQSPIMQDLSMTDSITPSMST